MKRGDMVKVRPGSGEVFLYETTNSAAADTFLRTVTGNAGTRGRGIVVDINKNSLLVLLNGGRGLGWSGKHLWDPCEGLSR